MGEEEQDFEEEELEERGSSKLFDSECLSGVVVADLLLPLSLENLGGGEMMIGWFGERGFGLVLMREEGGGGSGSDSGSCDGGEVAGCELYLNQHHQHYHQFE